jgi:signal transduction histidine kinase/Tfp pilus assembly protein PilF
MQMVRNLSVAWVMVFLCVTSHGKTDSLSPLQAQADSLYQLIEDPQVSDTALIPALIDFSWLIKSTDPERALDMAERARHLATGNNDPGGVARALNNLGVIYWQLGSFPQALDFLFDAFHHFRDQNDSLGIARTQANIGLIFSDQGHHDRALEYYLVALGIYQQIRHAAGIATVMNNIGKVHYLQGDYAQAEWYHLESLKLKREPGNKRSIAFSLNNLGLVRQAIGDHDQALSYYREALEIRQELQDTREMAVTIENIGSLYLASGAVHQAVEHFFWALALYGEINDKSGLASIHHWIGKAWLERGQQADALASFQTSLDIAERIGLARMVSANLLALSRVMARVADYRSAYNYQQQYLALLDSLYNEESHRRVVEMQLLFDRERKENEIDLLRKNNEIIQLTLDKQRLLQVFLLLVIALALALLILLLNRYRYARESHKKMEEQRGEVFEANRKLQELNHSLLDQKQKVEDLNRKLHEANQQLSDSHKHLVAINSTKDKFFSIISHDLRNPFASIVSFSRILKRDIDALDREELRELVSELDKSVHKINELLENLLHWSRAQTGKITYEPAYLDLGELVREVLKLFAAGAREKEVAFDSRIPADMIVWADRNMLNAVLRNLLSNALKYTGAGGSVWVDAAYRNGSVEVSVTDTGVGIPDSEKQKLFRVDFPYSTYGTRDEKGSGLGLLLCREFVDKLGGDIWFESETGKGSCFRFTLPTSEGRQKA